MKEEGKDNLWVYGFALGFVVIFGKDEKRHLFINKKWKWDTVIYLFHCRDKRDYINILFELINNLMW